MEFTYEKRRLVPADFDHGSRPMQRVPLAEQQQGFLESLKERGAVVPTGEDWSGDVSQLPPEVEWAQFPNGDLMRVRTSR